MIIEKHNIFELIDKGTKIYHSAILTTFSFDPVFFEMYYMPQLRRRGIRNVIVLVDAGQYDSIMSMNDDYAFSRKDYAILRVESTLNGVFHPKIAFLVGKDKVMSIIGSGNLTYSGIAHNDELWGAFCIDNSESSLAPLTKAIWIYLNNLITSCPIGETIKCQLEWIKQFSNTIQQLKDISEIESKHNDNKLYFLHNDKTESIFSKINKLVKGKVQELAIISPFYDTDSKLIQILNNKFKPSIIKCVIQLEGGILPN